MKKAIVGLLMVMVIAALSTVYAKGLIKVGIVNLPPEESGYRQANVEDMNKVFSKANGYDAKQTNTGDNSEQIAAAKGYIREGVDYLLISAANSSGWDDVLKSAKKAGVKVILFDRAINTSPSNYQVALLSDMAYEGNTAVNWVLKNVPKPIKLVLIRGQLGSAAEIGRSAAVLKAAKAGKLTIVADGTGGDLRKPAKWLKPRLQRKRISTSSTRRTTVWRKAPFRPSRRPELAMAKKAKSRSLVLTLTVLHSGTSRPVIGTPTCNAIRVRPLKFLSGSRVVNSPKASSIRKNCS
jgi:hypothetical protein